MEEAAAESGLQRGRAAPGFSVHTHRCLGEKQEAEVGIRQRVLRSLCRWCPNHSVMMPRLVESQDLLCCTGPGRCLGRNLVRNGSSRGHGGWFEWRFKVQLHCDPHCTV